MSECKAELDLYSVKARASAAGGVATGGACLLCQREFIVWFSVLFGFRERADAQSWLRMLHAVQIGLGDF